MRFIALLPLIISVFYGTSAAQDAADPVYFFDMTDLHALDRSDPVQARRAWDTAHLVASLQGIVNRDAPVLFVRFMPDPDDFWFDSFFEEGGWLAGRRVERIESLEKLLETFAAKIHGVVVYDERVWATSNLASTIAGVEDRVCLRRDEDPGSIYGRVFASDLSFTKDILALFNEDGSPMFTGSGTIPGTALASTGSAKCDAYLWLKERYLDTGKCSPNYMAYYIDAYWLTDPLVSNFSNATLTNHDFFIANRAFFFDLHVWEEESPVDDPGQKPGTDVATLRQILRSMYNHAGGRIFQIGGFTPWAWKYTNHGKAGSQHGGVDTEWKYAQIISAYNGIMDADALGYSGMANASFYRHYPLKDRYPQNPKPTRETLIERGLIQTGGTVAPKTYVCFYMGDYDSAAWLNIHVPRWWRDPAHGETLCTWAFNPNLDRRAPHALDYARTHQSRNDWFMFGDSGAGYLNPGQLIERAGESDPLPDGLDAWVAHNRPYAECYDLSITGFIIDGHSPGMGERGMDAYLRFSPDGIVGQKIPSQGLYRDTMPYTRMKVDLGGSPGDAANTIAGMAGINGPKFLFVRTILQSPSWHKETMAKTVEFAPNVEFLDPYSFFLLLKTHELNNEKGIGLAPTRSQVVFTAPNKCDGLAPLRIQDGPYQVAEKNGRHVIQQSASDAIRYLYFETADTFARYVQQNKPCTIVVAVTLLDTAPMRIGIHYDVAENRNYKDGPEHNTTGSGEWIPLTFELPEAGCGHAQNGGADGSPQILWRAELGAGVAGLILADVNGDRATEIVVSTVDGYVRVLGQAPR